MTTTPEEFFAKGLIEQSPPSPPVFLDIPPKPSGSTESQHHIPDNMMLPHISRVLFEDEDIDDKLSNDPALLQVQQPFAQILSCPPFGANTRNMEGRNDLLQDGCREEIVPDMVLSKSNEVVQAFLKGMEDANKFLPKDNHIRRDNLVNQIVTQSSSHSGTKKKYNKDDHQEEARTSETVMTMKEAEDNSASDILDKMMMQAYQTCIWGMNKLRVTMENKHQKYSGRKASRDDVVDICTLLIACAEAVAANDHMGACLLQLLASREGALPEVKITAIGPPKRKSYPAEQIEEIGCRLRKCANKYGLPPFKFHTVTKKWEDVCIKDLDIDIDEVLVVNDLFNFSSLMDESVFFDDPSPRDIVLDNIKKMKPDVFIQSILNCSCGSSFITRFRETMFYLMALFDILDATIPRESKSRVVLEQFVLGSSAVNAIAVQGVDLVEHPEKYRQWQARNRRVGLRQLPLKSSIIEVVKDEVVKHHHKDFFIGEDGQWLLQGWMGRVLFAHSTWVAEDCYSS
nr:unnamed protein product [Digitaria exilis]